MSRSGFTFEANLGIGLLHAREGDLSETELAVGGLSLGLGSFVAPNTAVTLRVAGGTFTRNGNQFTQGVVGPYVQQWITPNAWVGGGAGLGFVAVRGDGAASDAGFGFGARAGFILNPGNINSFNISGELTTSFHQGDKETFNASVLAILIGYQRL